MQGSVLCQVNYPLPSVLKLNNSSNLGSEFEIRNKMCAKSHDSLWSAEKQSREVKEMDSKFVNDPSTSSLLMEPRRLVMDVSSVIGTSHFPRTPQRSAIQ